MRWGKRPQGRASDFATYEAPSKPTIHLRGGYELTVDRFEYVTLGGSILARVEGELPEPGYPLPRLALVVGQGGARDRIRALPAPDSHTPPDRWRAAFPLNQEIVDDPDVEFSLYAAGRLVELDPPRARSLDPVEAVPSRRERLLAQRAERQARLAELEDEPLDDDDAEADTEAETEVAEVPAAEEPVERPRRRFAEPEAVEDEVEVVEAEIVDESAEADETATLIARIADLERQLAEARAKSSSQHAEMRRALAHERAETQKERDRAELLASQVGSLDRSVAKARQEAAAAEQAAADAAENARAEAEAAAHSVAAENRHAKLQLWECLRRMVESADRVAAAEAERESVRERLRGALFDIGGSDPEGLVAHEQALSELLEHEHEQLDEAWERARELVAAQPGEIAVNGR